MIRARSAVMVLLYCAVWPMVQGRFIDERRVNVTNLVEDDDYDLENALNEYYEDDTLEKLLGLERDKNLEQDESYDYMSDMPADDTDKKTDELPSGLNKTNGTWTYVNNTKFLYEDIQKELRARSKESRLSQILEQIIRLRNGSDLNMSAPLSSNQETLRKLYEQNSAKVSDSTVFTRFQSFYPSCDVPRNTDEDIWNDGTSMNLLFDLTFPTSSDGSSVVTITSAKLRLFKLSQGGGVNRVTADPPTTTTTDQKEQSPLIPYYLLQPGSNISTLDDDRRIRVTAYWYTRSLKKHRVKRKLLDSHMLSVVGEEWTDFDIKTAVKAWRESGRNFGLLVTVEDEDGTLLPVDQHIYILNCTKSTSTARPIPGILMDAAKDYFMDAQQTNNTNGTTSEAEDVHNNTEAPKLSYDSLLYPMVDLCTVEIPTSELGSLNEYNSGKMSIESHISTLARKKSQVEFINSHLKNYTVVLVKNENLEEFNKNGGFDFKNNSENDKKNKTEAGKKPDQKKQIPEADDSQNLAVTFNRKNPRTPYQPNTRKNYFQTVPLGSPSAQKTEQSTEQPNTTTEQMQNDSPNQNEKHVIRHPRRRLETLQKEIEHNLKLTLKEIKMAENVEKQLEKQEKI